MIIIFKKTHKVVLQRNTCAYVHAPPQPHTHECAHECLHTETHTMFCDTIPLLGYVCSAVVATPRAKRYLGWKPISFGKKVQCGVYSRKKCLLQQRSLPFVHLHGPPANGSSFFDCMLKFFFFNFPAKQALEFSSEFSYLVIIEGCSVPEWW